jgi:glutamate-1-semialdehyde 2,1-aminomutase
MATGVASLFQGSTDGFLTEEKSSSSPGQVTLGDALQEARDTFIRRLPQSKKQYDEAVNFLPGGNTRSVLFTEPFPVFMKKGRENRLWDCDGNE